MEKLDKLFTTRFQELSGKITEDKLKLSLAGMKDVRLAPLTLSNLDVFVARAPTLPVGTVFMLTGQANTVHYKTKDDVDRSYQALIGVNSDGSPLVLNANSLLSVWYPEDFNQSDDGRKKLFPDTLDIVTEDINEFRKDNSTALNANWDYHTSLEARLESLAGVVIEVAASLTLKCTTEDGRPFTVKMYAFVKSTTTWTKFKAGAKL